MIKKLTRFLAKAPAHFLYIILKVFGFTKKDYTIPSKITAPEKEVKKKSPEKLIIIDDDIGLDWEGVWKDGHFWLPWFKITDPDGGLELIYALRDPNVKVLGITIMMGVANTDVCVQAAKNTLKVLGMEDIPVLAGAKSPDDLGKETEAARFIVDTVMNNPGKVEIIATGPLTNIATAMMLEPKLPQNWKTLHFATGEFRGKLGEISDLFPLSFFGIPDLNVNVDFKATNYVLKHGGPFPIYPNEVMDDVMFNRADYQTIKNAGTELSKFIAYELKIMNFLYNHGIPFGKGIVTHGVVPTGIALEEKCDCKIIESAVELKYFKIQGYAFVLSNNPSLPKHKIYVKLSEPCRRNIHRKLIQRLI